MVLALDEKCEESQVKRCEHTREELYVPLEIAEGVDNRDVGFGDREFNGFYVSPYFNYYRSREDYFMFTED